MSIQSKYNYTAKRDDYLTPSVIYERVLEENGLENGQVELSMEVINESYKEKLKNGFK